MGGLRLEQGLVQPLARRLRPRERRLQRGGRAQGLRHAGAALVGDMLRAARRAGRLGGLGARLLANRCGAGKFGVERVHLRAQRRERHCGVTGGV